MQNNSNQSLKARQHIQIGRGGGGNKNLLSFKLTLDCCAFLFNTMGLIKLQLLHITGCLGTIHPCRIREKSTACCTIFYQVTEEVHNSPAPPPPPPPLTPTPVRLSSAWHPVPTVATVITSSSYASSSSSPSPSFFSPFAVQPTNFQHVQICRLCNHADDFSEQRASAPRRRAEQD